MSVWADRRVAGPRPHEKNSAIVPAGSLAESGEVDARRPDVR